MATGKNNKNLNDNIHEIESAVEKLNKAFGQMFDDINENLKATAANVQKLATAVNSNNSSNQSNSHIDREAAKLKEKQYNRMYEDIVKDTEESNKSRHHFTNNADSPGYRKKIRDSQDEIDKIREAFKNGKISKEEAEEETRKLQIRIFNAQESLDKLAKQEQELTKATESIKNSFLAYGKEFLSSFKSGASNYFKSYEQTFTNVASRMGTSYEETTSIYSNLVYTIDSATKSAIMSISGDLVPALNEAAGKGQGFKGDKAVSKAYSDVIDSKVMPWLTTSSESYVNLFANLSDSEMKQIKNQQLQLQKSEAGNRILQSQADTLLQDIAPLLLNIEGYTGGIDNLGEYQSMYEKLVANGYGTSEAYSYIKEIIDAEKNPYKAITSGSTSQRMYSIYSNSGYSPTEAYNMSYGLFNEQAGNLIASGQYYAAGALSTETGSTAGNIEMTAGFGGILEDYTKSNEDIYSNSEKMALEYTTTTKKLTNWLGNASTQIFSFITGIPFGDTFYDQVINVLTNIYTIVKTMAISSLFKGSVSGLLSGGSSAYSSIKNTLKNMFGTGAHSVSGGTLSTISNIASRLGGAAAIANGAYDIYSRSDTSGEGSKIASIAQIIAGLGAVVTGATGAGAAFLALGIVAKGTANALDKTSSMVTEVKDKFNKQKEQIEALTTSEEKRNYAVQAGLITQEQANTYTDSAINNLLEYETSTKKLKEDKKAAQAEYEANSTELISKINNLENSGNTDAVYDILKSAGATEKQLEKYLSGDKSAESILTSKKFLGIFGAKSLLQSASSSDWDILKEVAGSYATGLAYVPEDEVVQVHKGERILTAEENNNYTSTLIKSAISSALFGSSVGVLSLLGNSISNLSENNTMEDVVREVGNQIVSAIRESKSGMSINQATKTVSKLVSYDESTVHMSSSVGLATL